MSVGIRLRASIGGWRGIWIPPRDILARIATRTEAYCAQVPLGYAATGDEETRLDVTILATEEPISFVVEGADVVVSARTSGGGPGYHAHVVRLLDHLAESLQLGWRADDNEGDDAGYWRTRDFVRLQQEMADWLRQIAVIVSNEADKSSLLGIAVGLNLDPRFAILPGHAATPDGFRPLSYFRGIAGSGDAEILLAAAAWFPWWNEKPDASDWERLGRGMLWTRVKWHSRESPGDHAISGAALACFDRARKLDPHLVLPKSEIAELERLRAPGSDDFVPAKHGIGYFRLDHRRELGAGWSIEAPGWWWNDIEDGHTVLIHDQTVTIRATALTVSSSRPLGFRRSLWAQETVIDETSSSDSWRRLTRAPSSESPAGLMIRGDHTVADSYLLVSIHIEDASRYEQALALARTIRPPETESR